jgi:hypothetical protein
MTPVMRRDLCVYLSGPLTGAHGYTTEENIAAALRVFLDCIRQGIPAFCPHLGGAFPSAWAVDYEQWIAYDLAMIGRCTHVLLLPRWDTSPGACREVAYAQARGTPIVRAFAELLDA